jgi:hypothetical protein
MEVNNKYQRGKIYKIISPHTDKIYIGSTCEQYLSQRLGGHKGNYKRFLEEKKVSYTTSFKLLELGDVEIILIESYPCNSKDELHSRERYYIDLNKDIIVNKFIPTRKIKEYRENSKEIRKQYLEKNKDKIREQVKQYIENHKDEIREHKQKIINCECGKIFKLGHKSRHERSEKHKMYELNKT